MTDLHDRLSNLIRQHGEQWLLDVIDVKYPESESAFVDRLNQEIDSIVAELEASAVHVSSESEEVLSNRIISLLRRAGYNADAETDNRGHVDIIVRSRRGWTWLAECKIHGSYEDLREGLRQLLTRYSTGRSPRGALLIFIKIKKGARVLDGWRSLLRGEKIEHFIRDADDERYCFISTHEHQTTGDSFQVRHVGVLLYYAPNDKSARSRAA